MYDERTVGVSPASGLGFWGELTPGSALLHLGLKCAAANPAKDPVAIARGSDIHRSPFIVHHSALCVFLLAHRSAFRLDIYA